MIQKGFGPRSSFFLPGRKTYRPLFAGFRLAGKIADGLYQAAYRVAVAGHFSFQFVPLVAHTALRLPPCCRPTKLEVAICDIKFAIS
jgi:hypothetical protein